MLPKKKVAIVANSTWNIYNFRQNIIKKLIDSNFEVIVIAPVDEYIASLSHIEGLIYVPLRRLSRKSTNPLRDLLLVQELFRIYRRVQPDLVIHYTIKPNIFGNFAAALTRTKSICVVTGLGYAFLHTGLVKNVTALLYRWSFKFSKKIIFENEDDCDLFSGLGISSRHKSLSVKGCGVDTDYYQPVLKQHTDNQLIKFIFIGRLLYDKGVVEYVEAARIVKKKYPNAVFSMLGSFDEENPASVPKEQLVEWIEHGLIDYHGSAKDVRGYIRAADCVVLPSYREGLPRVILEAMAMAKPVITTDTAGCRETVTGQKNGFLVPVKDIPALAAAMIRFYKLPQPVAAAMGAFSRERALSIFNDKIIANQFLSLIEEVLAAEPQLNIAK